MAAGISQVIRIQSGNGTRRFDVEPFDTVQTLKDKVPVSMLAYSFSLYIYAYQMTCLLCDPLPNITGGLCV